MSRRQAVVLIAVVAVTIAAAHQIQKPTVAFVDVSDFPVTRVVFTPPGELLDAGLSHDDVQFTQDGEPVEFVLHDLGTEPIETVLLVDISGSMAGAPIAAAKAAAIDFVRQVPSGSEISVVAVGDTVEIVAPFTSDLAVLEEAIGALGTGGETSIYDAVIESVGLVESAPLVRQFIILLSDGGDTASTATLEDAIRTLQPVDIGFYAVALQSNEADSGVLMQIAEASEGRVVEATDAAALSAVYREIASELASQFAIEFQAIGGGDATFAIAVTSPLGSSFVEFGVELPFLSETAPTSVTTVAIPTIPVRTRPVLSPPNVRGVEAPGLLAGEWALTVGIASIFVVLTLAFALALWPRDYDLPRRRRAIDDQSRRFDSGRLGRTVRTVGKSVDRVMELRSGRRAVDSALDSAGVALRPGEFVVLSMAAALLGFLLGLLAGNFSLAIALGAGSIVLPRFWLKVKGDRRKALFADQLEGALLLIAGSLRAGYGVTQAINTVATESAEPSQTEFGRVIIETRLGRELEESLDALADRMENPDLRWVNDAIEIQRGVGGDLAEVLDAVSKTIRERNQIRRQVQTLTAEGRLSAIILVALPFGLAGFISVTNPGYLAELTSTTVGKVMLATGGVLMAIGIVWIRKLVRIEY